MKCEASSRKTHDVLISKEISWKSYKEICSGEKTKVNLANWGNWLLPSGGFKVENNSLVHIPREADKYIHGKASAMSYDWEVLSKFFLIHNIEPNWLDCNKTFGYYDEELGGWTGCVGKVRESEY